MDAKLRGDLFKKYTQSLEGRLEEDDRTNEGTSGESGLLSAAATLLGTYQPDPGQRFRLVRFYEVAENALLTLRSSSLQALETAFAVLETVCTNLLLFPWKKEFRCIKTFTGPYVYHLQMAVCDADLRSLLCSMGYSREELQFHAREHPSGALHLRQLAFELFLARAECRLLGEVVARAGGAATELEAVEVRRGSREDVPGCAEALRRRDPLAREVSRLSIRQAETERTHLRRGSRPSKSVDVTDSAGHWHQANKPVLKASLSLRKEPLFVDAEEDLKDEIMRPNTPLLSVPALPSYSSVSDFFPMQSPPVEPYSYHLSSLDELDLYTERGVGRCSRPPSRDPWEARESWGPKGHGAPSFGVKCQSCSAACPGLTSCPKCDTILCPACNAADPSPCCGLQDYPKASHTSDGYLPGKEKASAYSNAHSQLSEKPQMATKLFPSKPSAAAATNSVAGAGGSRCGFCNKPGASHTCLNCSKVSCDSCMSLYAKDMCSRKNVHHNFVPNHQLNYKSSSVSHLVYR